MQALTILGNNSAIPAFDRFNTAQILQMQDESFLIDCGEGTQMQMAKYKIKRSKISRIFISHLHGDHYFGLIGLLNSMSLLGRTQDLHLYAPAPLEKILQLQMEVADTRLSYNFYFHALGENQIIVDTTKITVTSFKVKHRIECWGFLFKQKKNPRKINVDTVRLYEIPTSYYERLQMGENYINKKGTIISNDAVTTAASPAKTYAYCADTIFDEELIDIVQGVDLLYHEATYLNGNEEKAALRYHSTTAQAATIAQKAGVSKLLIGHFSAKYEFLDEFLQETVDVFPNAELALEGVSYRI
jgi:ribonuclease Z